MAGRVFQEPEKEEEGKEERLRVEDYLELLLQMPGDSFKKGLILCRQDSGKIIEDFYRALSSVLIADCPQGSSAKELLRSILKEMGVDSTVGRKTTLAELESAVLHYLSSLQVKVLVLRGFDRVLSGKPVTTKRVLATLKSLLNRSGTAVVLTGTEDVRRVIETEKQLLRRFKLF